jgi:uncharacterized oxidoreductase
MQDVAKQQDTTINHMLMFIIDPNVFGGQDSFRREVMGMRDWLHSSDPAVGFDRVRTPGEPERETMAERLEKGIQVDEQSWDTICTAAIKAGMSESEVKVYT